MSLQVFIANATNVPNVETLGKSDPYAIVEYQGLQKKTEVKKADLDPVWNQSFEFDLKGQPLKSSDEITLRVKDWERVGRNRLLGTAKVPLKEIVLGNSRILQLKISLLDHNERPTTAVLGVTISYRPPAGSAPKVIGKVVTVGKEEEDEEEEEEEAEDEVGEDDADGLDSPDGPVQPGQRKKKKKKKKLGSRKIRSNLSNKPQDFQIRIKIVEARQLPGSNISPIARIRCYNQTKQTRVQRSTNSPFWNEVFFFNFFCSPAELFDELVVFGVYNSRNLRSDAFIGSFKCDIGMIHEEPQHSLVNKWLLLSDPDDTQAGAKGYLKICATVLGPGDDVPTFRAASQDDEEDIEANLLRPAGVLLRPATFKLKLYRAEDIPRMDSDFIQGVKKVFGSDDKKELVDPYFVFSFAGKEVRSKIMYNNSHPEWNQELRLGLQFPSMCERMRLQMFDWDRVSEHDVSCTAYLNMSQFSRPGNSGFLPTFGPCFVNFYGSTREYSDLPDEHEDLNLGKGEGVAYRGRALVELQSVLGEMPETPIDDLLNEDVYKIQKFMRRRKYKLHAAFLNATMISQVDAPVEFEVSIGNYGNKLDDNVPPCSSTTQPTNAVFDGCFYYFLPWGDTKPCVVIDSHWEDIGFRLETVNFLSHIIERLEMNMEQVRLGQKANLAPVELAQLIIALLDQLILDCRKPLPPVIEGQHVENDLDRNMRYYREVELEHIRKDARHLRLSATDIKEAMQEVELYLAQLKNIAVEPQSSMPDVIIWMICGDRRVAYYRAPAHQLLWSPIADYRGKFCGKLETITLKYPGNKVDKENKWEIPALLRVKIWLGLEKHEAEWHKMQTEGELAVFAETYENQVTILGSWGNKGPTMTRPKWSDATGKVKLRKDSFVPPAGWRWDGDWYISPELSMLFDLDAGHKHFLEDCYECHSRYPGGSWGPASVPWTNIKGDMSTARDEVELPNGWDWQDDWLIDLNRAVDEEGWEYTIEITMGGYTPVERNYHMCRRRRWVRARVKVKDIQVNVEEEQLRVEAAEGWEYAPFFNMKFHHKERKMDLVRRRRWHRKMVAESSHAPCFFQLRNADEEEEAGMTALAAPRMFLTCTRPHKYQLRAYIYQARNLLAGDSNGLSDPFARVIFLNQSDSTEKLEKTLCPTWDQTLMFEEIEIHGQPESIMEKPPKVVVEIFDYDNFGSAEFLGRTEVEPLVKLGQSDDRPAVLQWYEVKKGSQSGGELLAACELFLISDDELLFKDVHQLMNGADLPFEPPKKGNLFLVPSGIRPMLQRTAIEVMCWGVRNMKKFQLGSVTSPNVELEVGGHLVQSKVIRNTSKNPNFDDPLLFFDIMLPREELYMPPLNIWVRDNRQFGRKPVVGVHVVRSLEQFRCNPRALAASMSMDADASGRPVGNGGQGSASPQDVHVVDMTQAVNEKTSLKRFFAQPTFSIQTEKFIRPQNATTYGSDFVGPQKATSYGSDKMEQIEEEIDWWSKYYASTGELDKCKQYLENGYDKIEIYTTELGKVGSFNDFSDFCNTFPLSRGKSIEEEESSIVGEFKGSFRVYPLPDDPNIELPTRVLRNLPPSSPEECVVRVYVIKAVDLQPNDPSGLADPYVSIRLGKATANNQSDYMPNTLNPVFATMFELKTTLPIHKDLYIRIKDYDLLGSDDIIGETVIDLENRNLSKYRATVGLPKTYCTSGPTQWRDSEKPKDILQQFCLQCALPDPEYPGNNVVQIGTETYTLAEFETRKPTHTHLGAAEQRLALHVLNTLPQTLGVPLTPEHIETRALYNPLQPGIEQGKLQMWVDIFPTSLGPPGPPVDITSRKPKGYVLRMVVWNTKDVILDEESITGEMMSDIYVKSWIAGIDDSQETDVHYRSLDGEGNFNWRMTFPFDYLPAEEALVVKKKEHFWSLDEREQHLPTILMVQVWDNDKFSADDFLGTLELNLNRMSKPSKKAANCTLDLLPDLTRGSATDVKTISLFEQKRVRGFWPCYNDVNGTRELTGKIEMELELLTGEEAEQRPVGIGRDEPNQHPFLEEPKRPQTSFLWFTSPLKTLRYIVWRNYKWYFIIAIIVIILILFLILFFYSFPGAAVNKLMGVV